MTDISLPLDPVLVAISELLPKIQDSQSRAGAPSSKVLNLIKGASLVDVLPPTPPIMPRRFQVRIEVFAQNRLTLVDERLGYMADVAAVGRHLRCGLDIRRRMAGHDGQAVRCQNGAGAWQRGAGGEGVETLGCGVDGPTSSRTMATGWMQSWPRSVMLLSLAASGRRTRVRSQPISGPTGSSRGRCCIYSSPFQAGAGLKQPHAAPHKGR